MLRHYAKITLLNARCAPVATLANIATLSIGLACTIVTYGIATFWDRAEQQFDNADRTFVVTTNVEFLDGSFASGSVPATNPYVARYLKEDFRQIEAVARARVMSEEAAISANGRAVRLFGVSVDSDFLRIFDLPFVSGDPTTALDRPRSVVLTEPAAQRLFGEVDPVGKTVSFANLIDGTVTGVIDEIDEPSHMGRSLSAQLRFDLLTSMDILDILTQPQLPANAPPPPEFWRGLVGPTYVLLPKDASLTAEHLEAQFDAFVERHLPAAQAATLSFELGLVPVTEVLEMAAGSFIGTDIRLSTLMWIFSGLILATACINYAGLATARALRGSRDIGLRKALGARATQVASQYIFESAMLAACAVTLAVILAWTAAPLLRSGLGLDLRPGLFSWQFCIFLTAVATVVTVVASCYPAFVLAKLRPVLALSVVARKPRRIGTALVCAQFSVAIFLLIAVVVVSLQNRELQRKGLGIGGDQLLLIENIGAITKVSSAALQRELEQLPNVEAVTTMATAPFVRHGVTPLAASAEDSAPQTSAMVYTVSHNFAKTFRLKLLAGRDFEKNRAEDVVGSRIGPPSVIIDRSLSVALGFGSVSSAVGQVIYIPKAAVVSFGGYRAEPLQIVGVVEDQPLTIQNVGPRGTIYRVGGELPYVVARIGGGDIATTIAAIDATWQRLAPHVALSRKFVDDLFDQRFESFARINHAFLLLSTFAVTISTIGLVALALTLSARYRREIAVRKIVGAKTAGVLLLLLLRFFLPVLLANLIAWPFAFIAARAYLARFVSPIELTIWPFALCLLVTLSIAMIAVGSQAVRAARLRPSTVVRYE